MKLYYMTGSCSFAIHCALRMSGAAFELDKVNARTKQTASGEDYLSINSKGYVPALLLDDGQLLTEVNAIFQYLHDQYPQLGLLPQHGSRDFYAVLAMLNFISSEVHKPHAPLFTPGSSDQQQQAALTKIGQRYDWLEQQLQQPYLFGAQLTAADLYLVTVLGWARWSKMELSSWPKLQQLQQRVLQYEAVQAALQAEGLTA